MVQKITFSIDEEVLAMLDSQAERQSRTRSSMIRWLVLEEDRRNPTNTQLKVVIDNEPVSE